MSHKTSYKTIYADYNKSSNPDGQAVTGTYYADDEKQALDTHIKNPILDVFIPEQEHTAFSEVITASKQVLIELKSSVDTVSSLRNLTYITGSASVSANNSEYELETTAAANDRIAFDSAEKGRYVPGYQSEAGLGIRAPEGQTLTGEQDQRWGYFDDNNGFFFGQDVTGFYVAVKRSGVITKTYQQGFNADKLDGTGESGITLDLAFGNVFEINYVWYGYGSARFYIVLKNENFRRGEKRLLIHTLVQPNKTSIQQPNLPLRVELLNGSTAAAHSLFVGGRQYSIHGKYNPVFRVTGEFVVAKSISTTFMPIISFKAKTDTVFRSQLSKFDSLTTFSDTNIIIGMIMNGTLTGASFANPTGATVNETSLQSDTAATAISGGIQTGGYYVLPGSNSRPVNFQFNNAIQSLINAQPFTLVARTITGTGSLTASMNIREEW